MEDYIGTIKIFAGNFAPIDYLKCEGQVLLIREYTALYSLLGTAYGGDAKDNFMLPDLRGRLIIDSGTGKMNPGDKASQNLTSRNRGDKGGLEAVTLTLNNIPPHTHQFNALSGNRESKEPLNNFLGKSSGNFYASKQQADVLQQMAPGTVGPVGGKAHENMPPFLSLTYIICVRGYFPPRPS